MEYPLFWQAVLLLLTGMYAVYHGMKWKETGDSKHALWLGIMIMCSIINLKPFILGYRNDFS